MKLNSSIWSTNTGTNSSGFSGVPGEATVIVGTVLHLKVM